MNNFTALCLTAIQRQIFLRKLITDGAIIDKIYNDGRSEAIDFSSEKSFDFFDKLLDIDRFCTGDEEDNVPDEAGLWQNDT